LVTSHFAVSSFASLSAKTGEVASVAPTINAALLSKIFESENL
jgi:hypothetical protein